MVVDMKVLRWLWLIAALLSVAPCRAQINPYADREQLASPDITQVLRTLRANVQENQWTFEVGYTSALDVPLQRLTGLNPPADLLRRAAQQNAQPQVERPARLQAAAAFDPNAASLDLRQHAKVTPVRNQLACGSCWAFATAGPFESSYAMVHSVPSDVSEQAILNCSGLGSCDGGWWAFDYLINPGSPAEYEYPYTADDRPCDQAAPPEYYASQWGYVSATSPIPTVQEIKQQLCAHGALAVAVNATVAFQAYVGGVFNENASGSVNHGVTLIGWDDSKQAWLIKNSWGPNWGSACDYGSERGYMWISYASNSIGYAAAWVDAGVTSPSPTPKAVASAGPQATSGNAAAPCPSCGGVGSDQVGQDLLCLVKIVNNVPGCVIEQIVSQFYFEDGTQFVCDRDVNVGHGEAGYCDSNTNSKCTKRVSTVIRIRYGGNDYTLTHETETTPAGECWILVPLELNPVQMVAKASTLNGARSLQGARVTLQRARH